MSRSTIRSLALAGLTAGVLGTLGFLLLGPKSQPSARADEPALQNPAGFHTTQKLLVTVNLINPGDRALTGELVGELLDGDKVIATSRLKVKQPEKSETHRLEFAPPKENIKELRFRCTFGKQTLTRKLGDLLLVKAHETSLVASQEFHVGVPASFRCGVHGVKSLTENVPLPGASVEVKLTGKDGKVFPLFSGKTGPEGFANVKFDVPNVEPGKYKLEVATKSALGEEKLPAREVTIKAEPKVLLVTDKPLYQPGQTIHIRALALGAAHLKPVANHVITFEVEDAKGNKVFKKQSNTSEHGIAHLDFQLASEVNLGEYQIRALLGKHEARKTVTVKQYVLPKFKTELQTDKKFYLPKETIKADLNVNYLFGKPVARGKVKVTASTFDVAFKEFTVWNGSTDDKGHVKFEVKLPDYFVGQPIARGNAIVKLEIKVTDTADHAETLTRTLPVAAQPMILSLIPEAGRIVPEVENRVFVAVSYPDGSPAANCEVKVWAGNKQTAEKAKPLATVKTSSVGLAEIKLTPKKDQFRAGPWGQRTVEMLGGTQQVWAPSPLLDMYAEATDSKGEKAAASPAFSSEPLGDNVLLRLDRAVYNGGDTIQMDIYSSAGTPTVYVDVVRAGQTMLTQWLNIKDGKASHKLTLPAEIFGTLEIHAYQQLLSGEVIRDARVVYVQPAQELKIKVKADKEVYEPGQEGTIRFEVTDTAGKPAAAALGVIIVDEAVYALQDLQPGLEKVFFTLQQELLRPTVTVGNHPLSEGLDTLVREKELPAARQQVAQVLLSAVRPKAPARWDVNPAFERKRQVDQRLTQIYWAILTHAQQGRPTVVKDKQSGKWIFKPDLLQDLVKGQFIDGKTTLSDTLGGTLTLEQVTALEPSLTPEAVARETTLQSLWYLNYYTGFYLHNNKARFFKNNKWQVSDAVLADVRKQYLGSADVYTRDAWGNAFKVFVRETKLNDWQWEALQFVEVVSAGPDGKFGTADDLRRDAHFGWRRGGRLGRGQAKGGDRWEEQLERRRNLRLEFDRAMPLRDGMGPMPPMAAAGPAGGGFGGGRENKAEAEATGAAGGSDGGASPPRIREFFPETMLWQPALITDDRGIATLSVQFADSITTWRLTASASSKGGLLGGVSAPLRVFREFFVDLDLPISLTQGDEIAFPIAVYNYLQGSQTVTLELEKNDWFELVNDDFKKSLEIKANSVVGVKFRLRARKIGHFPIQVTARGSKSSDAIRRFIEVVPNGKRVETSVTDRLAGKVTRTISIPEDAIADTPALSVKIYSGVFSQIVEGLDGMLRMPGGCFEQTSSSAYPNVLIADYVKTAKLTNSATILARAEAYLNQGYQRLLTFERPGGGFDWWGSGEPLVWLSAYGLQEFNDMARVWPVDRGIIDRTQKFLIKKMDPQTGTWSQVGATHGEAIERLGDPRLPLTAYVVWSLLDSKYQGAEINKSIEYIRENVKKASNPYVLALAANALAAYDPKHESTVDVLRRLSKLKTEVEEWKAICFKADGQSLNYARGDYLTVEVTALTVLAMIKAGGFNAEANKALAYLVKSRGPHGTWGTTQGTILALKALIAGAGGTPIKGTVPFTIWVNDKEAARGEVDEKNADVMQVFDLKDFARTGKMEVTIEAKGDAGLNFQIVARHYEAHNKGEPQKPTLEVSVDYDRTRLAAADLLKAKATLKNTGKTTVSMMMLEIGLPPGFAVDAGDFAEMVAAKKLNKFSVTGTKVILYLGDVKPDQTLTFEYGLRAKYPIKARTPQTVAYEYYTPSNRAATRPVELVVTEKK